VSKVVLCGKRNIFASFLEDHLHFSWQAQLFGEFHRHFAWQAQYFRRVVSGLREVVTANSLAVVAFGEMR